MCICVLRVRNISFLNEGIKNLLFLVLKKKIKLYVKKLRGRVLATHATHFPRATFVLSYLLQIHETSNGAQITTRQGYIG